MRSLLLFVLGATVVASEPVWTFTSNGDSRQDAAGAWDIGAASLTATWTAPSAGTWTITGRIDAEVEGNFGLRARIRVDGKQVWPADTPSFPVVPRLPRASDHHLTLDLPAGAQVQCELDGNQQPDERAARKRARWTLALALASGVVPVPSLPAAGTAEIQATAHGVVADDGRDDLPALHTALAALAAAGGGTLHLPAGTLDLGDGTTAQTIDIKGMLDCDLRGVVVDGLPRTRLLRHWPGRFDGGVNPPVVHARGMRSLALRGFSIDHDPPVAVAGPVITADQQQTVIELPAGMSRHADMRLYLCGRTDVHGRLISGRINSRQPLTAQPVDGGNGRRLAVRAATGAQPGDLLYGLFSIEGGQTISTRCVETFLMEDIRLHSVYGLVLTPMDGRDATFRRVVTEVLPGRVMAVTRDIGHPTRISGTVRFEDCVFTGAQDDGINILGSYIQVSRRLGDREFACEADKRHYRHSSKNPGRIQDLAVGSLIHLLDPLHRRKATVRVAAWWSDGFEYRIRTDSDLPAALGAQWTADPQAWSTARAEIVRCSFSNLVGRGIKFSARTGLIADCTFEHLTAPGIHLGGEFDWEESSMPDGVEIRGNTFINCAFQQDFIAPSAILIHGKGGRSPGLVRNVVITGNTFRDQAKPCVQVITGDTVRISGNTYERVGQPAFVTDPKLSRAVEILDKP